jgi:hypothetical protein
VFALFAYYTCFSRRRPHARRRIHSAQVARGIDADTFKRLMYVALMLQARGLITGDYSTGYQYGVCYRYHGEKFATAAEHERWSRMVLNGVSCPEFGRGYRDGLAGRDLRRILEPADEQRQNAC